MKNKKETRGRKPFNQNVVGEVLTCKENGMSIREIANSIYIYDKDMNKKFISKSYVWKIVDTNLNKNKELSTKK